MHRDYLYFGRRKPYKRLKMESFSTTYERQRIDTTFLNSHKYEGYKEMHSKIIITCIGMKQNITNICNREKQYSKKLTKFRLPLYHGTNVRFKGFISAVNVESTTRGHGIITFKIKVMGSIIFAKERR